MLKKISALLFAIAVSVSSFAFQVGDVIALSVTFPQGYWTTIDGVHKLYSEGTKAYLGSTGITCVFSPSCLWQVVAVDGSDSQYSLYNAASGKYISMSGDNLALSESPFAFDLTAGDTPYIISVSSASDSKYSGKTLAVNKYNPAFYFEKWDYSAGTFDAGAVETIINNCRASAIIPTIHVMQHVVRDLPRLVFVNNPKLPYDGSADEKLLQLTYQEVDKYFALDDPSLSVVASTPINVTSDAQEAHDLYGVTPVFTITNSSSTSFSLGAPSVSSDAWAIPVSGQVEPAGSADIVDEIVATVTLDGVVFTASMPLRQPVRTSTEALNEVVCSLTPSLVTFPMAGGTVDIEASANYMVGTRVNLSDGSVFNEGTSSPLAVTLSSSDFSVTDNNYSFVVSGSTVHLTAGVIPRTDNRQAVLTWNYACEYNNVNYESTASANISQRGTMADAAVKFISQKGVTGENFDSHGLQRTHEVHKTIFTDGNPASVVKLHIHQNTYAGWYRWYDYDNQRSVPTARWAVKPKGNNGQDFLTIGDEANGTDQGCINAYKLLPPFVAGEQQCIYNNQGTGEPSIYAYDDGQKHRIALDVSAYTDYVYTENTVTEPTLSYRVIYTITPPDSMATALAACKDNDQFLEEYVISAPVILNGKDEINLKTKFEFNQGSINYGYVYYDESSSSYKFLKESDLHLFIDGVQQSTMPGTENYVTVKRPASPSAAPVVYTLVSTQGYNVAKWTVTYHAVEEIGPMEEIDGKAILTTDEMNQNYVLLAKYDFNFAIPGTTDFSQYNHPLPWDECNYGFAYPMANGYPTGNSPEYVRSASMAFPYLGEYTLLNRIHNTSDAMGDNFPHDAIGWITQPQEQRGGAANGYMLYCDGTRSQGKIVSLKIDAQLCVGQRMFCSLWINSVNQNSNFQVELLGVDPDGTEHIVSSMLTGEIPTSSTSASYVWRQILFPISLTQEYDTYRMNFYNFSPSDAQNDFLIDDIRIYSTHAPVTLSQAFGSCASDADMEKVAMVARIAYAGILSEHPAGETIYYQWYDDNAHAALPTDYLGGNTSYGKFVLPSQAAIDADTQHQASSIDAFLHARLQANDADRVANYTYCYATENIDGGVVKVLYIVHDLPVEESGLYSFHIDELPEEANAATYTPTFGDEECAFQSSVSVDPKIKLVFNGEVIAPPVRNSLCVNQEFDLSIHVSATAYAANGNVTITKGQCMADWMVGALDSLSEEEVLSTYGYTYNQIYDAIVYDLRRPSTQTNTNINLTAGSLNAIDKSNLLSAETYNIIEHLVNKGLLHLSTLNIETYLAPGAGDLEYTVFPTANTGTTDDGESITVCVEPIFVHLNVGTQGGEHSLIIGDPTVSVLPPIVAQRPIRVRMSADECNATFVLPIREIKDVQIGGAVTLESSTDKSFVKGATVYTLSSDIASDEKSVTLVPTYASALKPGHEYKFRIPLLTSTGETSDDGCDIGSSYFTILVVPDYLRWNPGHANSAAWNNDDNWVICDEKGALVSTTGRGYVPMPHTTVFIPHNDAESYPILPTATVNSDTQILPLEEGATAYISYDVNFASATCKNICFGAGAQILNQERLTYEKAFVDMQMPSDNWIIIAPALKSTYSGDMFIPVDNEVNSTLAAPSTFTGDRISGYMFWQALFNRKADSVGINRTKDITSLTWSAPSNALSTPYRIGEGVAVYGTGGSPLNVRLPKSDTRYYYYYMDGSGQSNKYVTLDRTEMGQFAYSLNASSQMPIVITNNAAAAESVQYFVFGNPTMAYIDIFKFIEGNNLESTFYYVDESDPSAGFKAANTFTATTEDQYLLSPMRGIIVMAKSGSAAQLSSDKKSLTLRLTPDMICLKKGKSGNSSFAKAPSRNAGYKHVLTINAARNGALSRLVVGESNLACDSIRDNEDAMLLLGAGANGLYDDNVCSTPFAIYADENDSALSIDMRRTVSNVPVNIRVMDGSEASTMKFSFYGVSSFDRDIYFTDTYTGRSIRLIDGLRIEVECPDNDANRYYIQWEPSEVPTDVEEIAAPYYEDSHISISLSANRMALVEADGLLRSVRVYNALGQEIISVRPCDTAVAVQLPQGVSIISAQTDTQSESRMVMIKD